MLQAFRLQLETAVFLYLIFNKYKPNLQLLFLVSLLLISFRLPAVFVSQVPFKVGRMCYSSSSVVSWEQCTINCQTAITLYSKCHTWWRWTCWLKADVMLHLSSQPTTKLFIDGKFVESKTSEWLDIHNPVSFSPGLDRETVHLFCQHPHM